MEWVWGMERESWTEWENTLNIGRKEPVEESKQEKPESKDSIEEQSHRSYSRDAKSHSTCLHVGGESHAPPQSEFAPAKDLKLLTTADWRSGLDIRLKMGQADSLFLMCITIMKDSIHFTGILH